MCQYQYYCLNTRYNTRFGSDMTVRFSLYPEDGLEFTTLFCRTVTASVKTCVVTLRDYTQPMVDLQDMQLWGRIIGSEQEASKRGFYILNSFVYFVSFLRHHITVRIKCVECVVKYSFPSFLSFLINFHLYTSFNYVIMHSTHFSNG